MAIEIHIEDDYSMYAKKVWVIEKASGEIIHYNIDNKGNLIETRISNSEAPVFNDKRIRPFMIMPAQFGEAFLLAFTKALTDQGIRTENEHTLEGKLKAMDKHLEDMRMIAFKGLKIEKE